MHIDVDWISAERSPFVFAQLEGAERWSGCFEGDDYDEWCEYAGRVEESATSHFERMYYEKREAVHVFGTGEEYEAGVYSVEGSVRVAFLASWDASKEKKAEVCSMSSYDLENHATAIGQKYISSEGEDWLLWPAVLSLQECAQQGQQIGKIFMPKGQRRLSIWMYQEPDFLVYFADCIQVSR